MNGAPSAMVSPGLWGFVAFFVLAIALYLLMRNMNARMRRMSYRSEELRKEDDAAREQTRAPDGGAEGSGDGGSPRGGDDSGEQGQTGGSTS